MNKIFQLVVFGIFISSRILFAQTPDCPCETTKAGQHHQRLFLKDRAKPAAGFHTNNARIGSMINSWKYPPQFEKDDTTVFPREKKIYRVKGYLRLAKIEDNDCDIHMEIGESESGKEDRIIAEIPNTTEYCPLRDTLILQLENIFGMMPPLDKTGTLFGEDTQDIPMITVTGYAFLDASHKSTKHPQTGNKHGSTDVMTLWEIHPVFQVKLEKGN